MNVRFRVDVSDEIGWGLFVVMSRGWFDSGIFIHKLEFSIFAHAKDWMLPEEDEIIGGKVYKTITKNPKYENSKVYSFCFP